MKDTRGFGGITAAIGMGATNSSQVATQYAIVTPGSYLWTRDTSDEYPIVFAQNEGFVVQATVPATGTWLFSTTVEWLEIAAFCMMVGLTGLTAKMLALVTH